MCLGVPGRVVDIFHEQHLLMATVDFGGVRKSVCLEHTPQAETGDYVLVHVGFALSVVDPDEAQKVFEFLKSMNELDEIANRDAGNNEVGGDEISSRIS